MNDFTEKDMEEALEAIDSMIRCWIWDVDWYYCWLYFAQLIGKNKFQSYERIFCGGESKHYDKDYL